MTPTVDSLSELYDDTKTCAKLVGLTYIESDDGGIARHKHGKGFSYRTPDNVVVKDAALKKRITELVIPPAWQEVWICPDQNGHLLATGIDEKGRKQYIYHPKWRTMRDLIKFYRMIIFGNALPKIRRAITANLDRHELDRDKVLGVMLWLLDNTYLRIGNEAYLQANESVGLTTLSRKNIVIAGSVTTLSFRGKSGQEHQITFDDPAIAALLEQLRARGCERLFTYREGGETVAIEASDINSYLHDVTSVQISAKDFRTWGGTLLAFDHLVSLVKAPKDTPAKKAQAEAVDTAALVLGNTRSVAKSSYVHPHILEMYGKKDFQKFYTTAAARRTKTGLDKRETELLTVLDQLFEQEFSLLQKT